MGLRHQAEVQSATLLDFYLGYQSLVLAGREQCWTGLGRRFVLLCEAPAAYAGCAQIAGAATLLLLEDRYAAKAAVRAGLCDFLVTQLDEALRILKNEVRRGAAVSVCLLGEKKLLLAECLERGVQPDLVDFPHEELVRRGAQGIAWAATLPGDQRVVAWRSISGSSQLLVGLDDIAARALRPGAADRLRWLSHAPSVLGRAWQKQRMLPMFDEEFATFVQQVRLQREGFTVVEVTQDGELVSLDRD